MSRHSEVALCRCGSASQREFDEFQRRGATQGRPVAVSAAKEVPNGAKAEETAEDLKPNDC